MVFCYLKIDGTSSNLNTLAQELRYEMALSKEVMRNALEKASAEFQTITAHLEQADTEIVHSTEKLTHLEEERAKHETTATTRRRRL
jgi:hypothetical protein